VTGLTPYNNSDGTFALSVRTAAGTNVFQIQAGPVSIMVSVVAQ
jgi:hypothetical protein